MVGNGQIGTQPTSPTVELIGSSGSNLLGAGSNSTSVSSSNGGSTGSSSGSNASSKKSEGSRFGGKTRNSIVLGAAGILGGSLLLV